MRISSCGAVPVRGVNSPAARDACTLADCNRGQGARQGRTQLEVRIETKCFSRPCPCWWLRAAFICIRKSQHPLCFANPGLQVEVSRAVIEQIRELETQFNMDVCYVFRCPFNFGYERFWRDVAEEFETQASSWCFVAHQ